MTNAYARIGCRIAHRQGEDAIHHVRRWRRPRASAKAGSMVQPNPVAGGFLLSLLILVGLVGGIVVGSPISGAVVGTAAGISVALLVWLLDRRKQS